jgi:hypothetical protein
LLNSIPARTFVNSYAIPTQIATGVTRLLLIPQFDPNDDAHAAMAGASAAVTEAARAGNVLDERPIDLAACRIWSITVDELDAMREFHGYLLKHDLQAT